MSVVDKKPVSPGEAVNTVTVLTGRNLVGQWRYQGSLTTQRFFAYLETDRPPHLLTGKTLNLDNQPVHRSGRVQSYLKHHRVPYVFLPTYSPELNSFEEAWSKF